MGPLNQWIVDDVNLLETPEDGFCNIMVAADKSIWGRFPDGTLHQFSANNFLNIAGSLDPAGGNIDYPASDAGDVWIFISAGTIGTPPIAVEQGEMLLTIVDSAGGAGAGADFTIYQINITYATQAVAGIVYLATDAKMESDVDDAAAVTPNKLYYLLQIFGIEWILTDEVRGRDLSGAVPLTIQTQQNPDIGGPQAPINIKTPSTNNATGVEVSANSGAITLNTGQPGSTEDGDGGASGSIQITTGIGKASTGSGIAGLTGNITIRTGKGGAGQGTGASGDAGSVSITTGNGGDSTVNATGGEAGTITISSGIGGQGKGANTGGKGGNVTLKASRGGNSTDANGVGGTGSTMTIESGASGNGDIGTGFPGNIIMTAGNSGSVNNGINGSQKAGGAVLITAGNGNSSNTGFPGDGGGILMTAGTGRSQTVSAGAGSEGGEGGFLRFYSGTGGSGTSLGGPGGTISIVVGGTGDTSDNGATGVDGGDILITAGNGGAGTGVGATGGNGGDIQVTPGPAGIGTATNGYAGTFQIATGFFAISNVADNIAANGAGGFVAATRLTSVITRVTNVPGPNSSVKLPLTAQKVGEMFKVRNDGVNVLDLFSPDGVQTINGAAVINVAAGQSVTIIRLTPNELYVFD